MQFDSRFQRAAYVSNHAEEWADDLGIRLQEARDLNALVRKQSAAILASLTEVRARNQAIRARTSEIMAESSPIRSQCLAAAISS